MFNKLELALKYALTILDINKSFIVIVSLEVDSVKFVNYILILNEIIIY